MPSSTSFSQHSSDTYSNYEKDRQTKSQEVTYTTSNGAPLAHPYETQRAGENGPLLLQDLYVNLLILMNMSTNGL
jgi:catalase